jgi:hypothetical protein
MLIKLLYPSPRRSPDHALAVFELYSPITPRPTRLRLRLRSITSENRFSTFARSKLSATEYHQHL